MNKIECNLIENVQRVPTTCRRLWWSGNISDSRRIAMKMGSLWDWRWDDFFSAEITDLFIFPFLQNFAIYLSHGYRRRRGASHSIRLACIRCKWEVVCLHWQSVRMGLGRSLPSRIVNWTNFYFAFTVATYSCLTLSKCRFGHSMASLRIVHA